MPTIFARALVTAWATHALYATGAFGTFRTPAAVYDAEGWGFQDA